MTILCSFSDIKKKKKTKIIDELICKHIVTFNKNSCCLLQKLTFMTGIKENGQLFIIYD